MLPIEALAGGGDAATYGLVVVHILSVEGK